MATTKKKTGSPTTRKARGSGRKESSGRNGSSRQQANPAKRTAPSVRIRKPESLAGETIGQRIKIAREKLGIAQVPFAEKCGLSQGYISDLERERRLKPSLEAIQKIAAQLGVTVGQLIGE